MNTQKEKAPTGIAVPDVDANNLNQLKDNTFLKSSQITKETRLKSYIQRPITLDGKVLRALEVYGPMTAAETSRAIGRTDRQASAPRLSTLKKKGKVRNTGEVYDPVSKRTVALWEKI